MSRRKKINISISEKKYKTETGEKIPESDFTLKKQALAWHRHPLTISLFSFIFAGLALNIFQGKMNYKNNLLGACPRTSYFKGQPC
ncbi:MAG: hypothetical protein K8S27_11225 [Candidatus Omnitrophica bacterium]|nr:hypothetical protein [Candidatus Omnitrophota bacterium]